MSGIETNKQCLAASTRHEENEIRRRKKKGKAAMSVQVITGPIQCVKIFVLCRYRETPIKSPLYLCTFASIDSWGWMCRRRMCVCVRRCLVCRVEKRILATVLHCRPSMMLLLQLLFTPLPLMNKNKTTQALKVKAQPSS